MTSNPMTIKSPNGYSPYDLMSAMQKFIRRSMEQEALWCFYELEACGLYQAAANRLMVTVYEDCGIGNQELLNAIPGHIEVMNNWYKAKKGEWRLVLGNIILQACRGNKNRIADLFIWSVAAKRVNGWKLDLEQYEEFIYDKHTLRGKRQGRGMKHFIEEGAKIINNPDTNDYTEDFATEVEKIGSIADNIWEANRLQAGSVQRSFFD